MISNIVLVIGVCITLVDDFGALCTGRVIYGLSIGAFAVFCPKFVTEIAPIEIKGSAGALNQV